MDLTLSLTHDCNLACSYCYAGPKRTDAMTMATAEKAIDLAFSTPAQKFQLGFFGGEPLMEWDLLTASTVFAESVVARHEVDLVKTLTTNATLLTAEMVQWLKEHSFFLAVSLDGNRQMHDATRPFRCGKSSFDSVIRGLDLLDGYGDMEVIVVVDPSNVMHLTESVRYLAVEKGVQRISINPNFYIEWSDEALEQWKTAYQEIGEFYIDCFRENRILYVNFINSKVITRLKNGFEDCDHCNFGEKEIAVAPSGNIYPCERLVADDTLDDMCIGNVVDGFDEDKRFSILQRRGNVNAECISCKLRHRCMNWCCCINYAMTGAIDSTDGILCFHERLAIGVADEVAGILYNESNPRFLNQFYYDEVPT